MLGMLPGLRRWSLYVAGNVLSGFEMHYCTFANGSTSCVAFFAKKFTRCVAFFVNLSIKCSFKKMKTMP